MDFEFINELLKTLDNQNIFRYSFTGAKILAFALLAFRLLDTFVRESTSKEANMGNILSIVGYGVIIMSSDWIITLIEDTFAGIDASVYSTSSDLFTELMNLMREKWEEIFFGAEDVWDYMAVFFSNIQILASLVLIGALGLLTKLADMSVTASFLVQRIFIIQLLKFLFPLAVALSTFSGTQKIFYSWILRYIGVFILGIAYIGIINIMSLVQTTLLNQFDVSYYGITPYFSYGIITTMVITFGIKLKLFQVVTSYVMGMFQ